MKIKIFLLSLLLLPFIIISFFNQPSNDDYWSADAINHYGRLGEVKYFAQNVNGRFFSNLIMGLLNPLPNGSLWLFKAAPIFLILLFICSFLFFYRSIFSQFSDSKLLFLSLLFVTLHILNMRRLFEGLYWTFAALSYQVSIMLFLVATGSLIRFYKSSSFLYLLIAIICFFVLPGSVESIEPIVFLFLCFILLYCITEKIIIKPLVICLAANLAGVTLVLVSKGNFSRVAHTSTEYKATVPLAVFYTFRSAAYYCFLWVINPANLFALLLLTPFVNTIFHQTNPKVLSSIKRINPIIFFVIGTLVSLTVYLPEHYFESSIPYPRITTIFLFAFMQIVVISFLLFLFRRKETKAINAFIIFTKKYAKYITVLFFISIVCSRNFLDVSEDLITGTAYHYNIESVQRFQYLKNCNADTCYVERHKYWPSSIENFFKEEDNTTPFIHIDKFFNKTILFKDSSVLKK